MSQIETPEGKIGAAIFGLAIALCSQEMVPGWGLFHLGWPPAAFYGIMIVCGGAGGLLMAPYRLPGLFAGVVAGVGGLYAMALVLQNVNTIHTGLLALVGILGALPGVGLYHVLCFPAKWMESRQRRDA